MTLRDAIGSAFDALRAHKLRSVLTMLGIVIGVAAVIAMVAVGGGAREQVVSRIKSLGSNLIIVIPGSSNQGGLRIGFGAASSLTDEDARAIEREIEDVTVAAPFVQGNVQAVAGSRNWGTRVTGVDPGWFAAREWEVENGRGFTNEEVLRGAQVVLLGATVAQTLFEGEDPIGASVRLRNTPFEVIGVMARKGQSAIGQDQDDTVFTPMTAARQRLLGFNRARSRAVGGIFVKAASEEQLKPVEDAVRALLRQRHRLAEDQEDDFSVRNLAEITATVEASARTLSLLLAAIAAVSLAVGGIGIMNIMLVSVTERTREIGVRMAVGARPGDVRLQFLIESGTLAAIGGAIGVVLGLAVGEAVSYFAGWPLLVQPGVIVLAVVFSGLVGLVSGWYPAHRASRLDPVEALRAG
jgi:putative ABC transport system permease protein